MRVHTPSLSKTAVERPHWLSTTACERLTARAGLSPSAPKHVLQRNLRLQQNFLSQPITVLQPKSFQQLASGSCRGFSSAGDSGAGRAWQAPAAFFFLKLASEEKSSFRSAGSSTRVGSAGQSGAGWSAGEQWLQQSQQSPATAAGAFQEGQLQVEQLVTLETNVDDTSPQLMAYVVEKLISAGALDAWMTPAIMKKGRPGVVLHVLCLVEKVNPMLTVILNETSTLGVRVRPCERVSVNRTMESVWTQWGWVPIKAAYLQGQLITATAEYEDCAAIARANSVPLKVVKAAAETAFLQSIQKEGGAR